MADEQKDLFKQLEKADVKIDKKAASDMKEKIMNDRGSVSYLGIGNHQVFVQSVELTEAKTKTIGIKFTVENEQGQGDVTMWLSEAALPYTIENISRILVHNAADDKKDKVRNFMSNIMSAKEVFEVAKEKMMGAICYLSIQPDRNGRTYTNKNGETKPSLERNLLSYMPKEQPTELVVKTTGGVVEPVGDVDLSNIPF